MPETISLNPFARMNGGMAKAETFRVTISIEMIRLNESNQGGIQIHH